MNDMSFVMIFAFVGWLASSYAIKHSRLAVRWQRLVIVPLWLAWVGLALGGPIVNGSIAPGDALTSAAACTVGMMSFLFFSALRRKRSSR
ncbi:MAG: hypothetical protein H0X37_15740 [Herpetosiphonaceae bacterium]|nr:hypothetical protein [Herpetosiphonaceae bacterium]